MAAAFAGLAGARAGLWRSTESSASDKLPWQLLRRATAQPGGRGTSCMYAGLPRRRRGGKSRDDGCALVRAPTLGASGGLRHDGGSTVGGHRGVGGLAPRGRLATCVWGRDRRTG